MEQIVFSKLSSLQRKPFSEMVVAVTQALEDSFIEEAMLCTQRCSGRVIAAQLGPLVRWVCPVCSASGAVSGWEGRAVDRRAGRSVEPLPRVIQGEAWPKVSETLGFYARPLLEALPPRPDHWTSVLGTVCTIWNALGLRDHVGEPQFFLDAATQMNSSPHAALIFDVLVARKQRLFSTDYRLITLERVDLRDGVMWIRANARDGRGV